MLPQIVLSQDAVLTVTKIDGTHQRGQLVGWNTDELTLRNDQQTITLAPSDLLRVEWRRDFLNNDAENIFIELVDGTLLPHQAFEAQAGEATISTLLAEQPLTISTEQIRFVQLAADAKQQDLTDQELDGDLLVVRKKSSNSFDYLSGIIGDISTEQVDFNWDGEVIPVKRSKIAALTYYHARPPAPIGPVCWLNLHNGARLPVAQIRLTGGMVEVSTIAGFDFSFSLETLRDADYSQGKLAYLSDMKPLMQQWTPRISLPASAELIRQHGLPRHDQSFSGSALTLFWPADKLAVGKPRPATSGVTTSGVASSGAATSGAATFGNGGGQLKTYGKGLALRSRTEIRYRVPAGMQRFVTVAGIDPETASEGDVTLELFADRRLVWQGEFNGRSAPTEITFPLGDARELRIVVDYGANLDFGDRLHLVEARLSK